MRIGIVGGGQLGRMLALAGYPLGLEFMFLDRSREGPAAQVAPMLVGELGDAARLRQLAERCDVISFDWENVPVAALRAAAAGRTRIAPPPRALAIAQDRLLEKRLFDRLRIRTTRYAAVDSRAALERAVRRVGLPGVLKTRRLGYDGRGQRVLRDPGQVAQAWRELGTVPLLYEEFVPFDYEVSIIGVRGRGGQTVVYPLSRNLHVEGILRVTRAPWPARALQRSAERSLRRVLEALQYVGTVALEFFVRDGRLIINEMAPRVHNSGHWTIEGAQTSQFENHVRAIAGLPLGAPDARGHCAMINLIGRMPSRAVLLAEPGVHLHDYGKRPRRGRKLGHCTVVEPTAARRERRVRALLARLYPQLPRQP